MTGHDVAPTTPAPPAREPRTVRDIAWMVLGRSGSMILGIGATAALARLLTPADFGLVAAAFVVVALGDAVFGGAFGMRVVQKHQVSASFLSTTFWLSLLLGASMSTCIALLAPSVERWFGFESVASVLLAMAPLPFVRAVGLTSRFMLQRRRHFRALASIAIVSYFVGYFLVAIPLAWNGAGALALALGAVLTAVIEAMLALALARVPVRAGVSLDDVRDMGLANSLFMATQICNWAANTGTNAVAGRMLGVEVLGLYSRSWKLLDIAVSAVAAPIQTVLFPAFSRLQNDLPRARSAFTRALTFAVPLFGIGGAMLVVHAEPIVLLAFGKGWLGTVPIVQVLFATLLPRCAFKISESLSFGLGDALGAAGRQLFYALMMIGGALAGSRYGAVGIALAAALAITIFYCLSMGAACRRVEARAGRVLLLHLYTALAASVLVGVDQAVMQGLPHAPLWARHAAGAGVAGGLLLAAAVAWPQRWLALPAAHARSAAFALLGRWVLRART